MDHRPSLHTFGSSAYIQTRDGRKLHYMSKGSGELTVVFESGMGLSRSTWGLVAPAIAEHARTVVYDRAGAGRSEVDSAPRSLNRMAEDLGDLLSALEPGPLILVGHSWGGPIVRTAAAANTSQLRGIVLVDPSDEHCELYFSSLAKKSFALNGFLIPIMAHTGLYRLLGSKAGKVQPDDVVADHLKEDFTVQAAKTMLAEGKTFLDDMTALLAQPPALDDLEVSVISGTKPGKGEGKIRPALIAAHRQTVSKLSNARWIGADQSGHTVMYTDPQVIIDEIVRMINNVSSGATIEQK
ncbi:alpha/beta hydrolase [Paenibacillus sp. Root52]|uniref:alpha/beta fold hydrolase n=1 Tax=Paenibacillus sp. Root52 TaxID=1736552 RepID=UPI0006F5EE3C|nr:alpha/beta hydrolase [Paenibacillus sp. Root52]KQY93628.1 alpha/beta hydrolase [Paenibacillus sp. Root52]